jgi:hypothetical protein
MHDVRFDHLSKALSGRVTRRSALALLAILGLADATDPSVEVAAKRRRNQKTKRTIKCRCKPCWWTSSKPKSRKQCCSRMKPDGSECFLAGPDGQCSGGECATPPECLARGNPCEVLEAPASSCCSDVCVSNGGMLAGTCACSEIGKSCLETSDCCTGTCVGFVCTG